MADKNLFPRLKRLFGNDTIIRNVGGKTLKVADVNQVQAFGNLETNRLTDRFSRLYTPLGSYAYNPSHNYQTLRYQMYSDYEAMDTDAIIASSLDILSEESTLKDEYGETLTIKTEDDNIKKILRNLFYDILNIDFNLPVWVRNMCKYGDTYLKFDITEKFGITNVIPLSTYQVVREEGTNPENPTEIRFKLENSTGYNTQFPTQNKGDKNAIYFGNHEIAHMRLLTDSNFLPYGRSYLEPARKLFKQYTLMEDAALIHRIMRAPEKRIFYINIGSIPPNEVDAFMEKSVNSIKKIPYVDPNTGDYNLKFNMQNMIEDFYIPVRGGDQTTRIDTTKGLEYDGMNDVEYYRNKLLAALRVPKAWLGYDENVDGKATLAATDMRFARTVEKVQRIIVSELYKVALIHLYVQGFDGEDLTNFTLELTNPSIIYEQEKVELYQSKVDLSNAMMESKLQSREWIYKNVWGMSQSEIDSLLDQTVEDAKHDFRISQLQEEGNDPITSGETYGTPHDLASMYANKRDKGLEGGSGGLPDGYDENEPGRPQSRLSNFGDEHGVLGRDPSGRKAMQDPNDKIDLEKPKDNNKVSTFESNMVYIKNKDVFKSLRPQRKKLLREGEELLDEGEVLSDD